MNSQQLANSSAAKNIIHFHNTFTKLSMLLAPVVDIILKLWVANVFFKSGLTKIEGFDTTIMLFSYEYSVPLLSPTLAAYLATGIELIFPVLLTLGLFGRFSALTLFFLNIIAAISYPDISDAGIRDHVIWGIMLLVVITNQSHFLTFDYHIKRLFFSKS